jgi:acetyl-CoA carboxylase beta subunit
MIDFYCEHCSLDYESNYIHRENSFGKWFVSKCPKCHEECIRYETEKHLDPFFRKSKKMRIELERHKDDLIQPGHSRFKSLYPEQWAKMQEAEEKMIAKQQAKKKERDEFYRSNFNERSTVRKILELEDAEGN